MQHDRRHRRAVAAGAGLFAIIAGLLAVSVLTQPGPASTTTTAPAGTTTTAAVVPGGELLAFETMGLDGSPIVIAPVPTGETVVVVASPDGSVEAMATTGGPWEHLPSPVEEGAVVAAGATVPDAVVLHGHDASGATAIWLSRDGRSWQKAVVDPSGRRSVVGVAGGGALIFSWGLEDGWRLLDAALVERMGPAGRRYQLFSQGDGPAEVLAQSPLGLPIGRFTLDELGVDPADLETGVQWAMASRDGVEWTEAALPDDRFPSSPFAGDDGRVYDIDVEGLLLSTGDGLTWVEEAVIGAPGIVIQPWRGWLSHGPDPILWASRDASAWREIDLGPLFAEPELWKLGGVAAGDAGLAVVAMQQSAIGEPRPATVEARYGQHLVRVTDAAVEVAAPGGETLVSIPRTAVAPDPRVSFDPAAQEVTIGDDAGTPLITLSIEELGRLEDKHEDAAMGAAPEIASALLTSPDGCAWTTQELGVGPGRTIHDVRIVGARVFLVIGGTFRLDRTELWWADLPAGGGAGDCPLE